MAQPPKVTTQYRSAKTGEYVTPAYAKTHQSTTVKEQTKVMPKPKGK